MDLSNTQREIIIKALETHSYHLNNLVLQRQADHIRKGTDPMGDSEYLQLNSEWVETDLLIQQLGGC